MDEQELKDRTKQFSLRIMKLVAVLPNTVVGRAIGNQLVRSGTSVGANYRAACRSRSNAEFIAKLGTVEEETDESMYWMELVIEAGLMKEELIIELYGEAGPSQLDRCEATLPEAQPEMGDFSNVHWDRRQIRTGNYVSDGGDRSDAWASKIASIRLK